MVRIVEESTEIYALNTLSEICTHIERCGRTCYKSENLITDETSIPFIQGILKSGHESVIEHANVIFTMPDTETNHRIFTMRDIRGLNISQEKDTENQNKEVIVVSGNMRALRDIARQYNVHDFLLAIGNPLFYIKENSSTSFENVKIESVQQSRFSEMHNYVTTHSICDIGAYKDITRHRLASFSIESTRFCNYSKGKFGEELTMIEPVNIDKDTEMYNEWLRAVNQIEKAYMKMASFGAKADQLRMLLPHSTKADMIMTANVSELKHIFSLRCHPAAHPSVRYLMKKILEQCYALMPDFFEKQHKEFIQ